MQALKILCIDAESTYIKEKRQSCSGAPYKGYVIGKTCPLTFGQRLKQESYSSERTPTPIKTNAQPIRINEGKKATYKTMEHRAQRFLQALTILILMSVGHRRLG